MAGTYAMSCLRCGQPLDEHGACPNCGAGSAPPTLGGTTSTRGRADVATPPGGAEIPGRTDRMGVFQAAGQRTNWFVRLATAVAAGVFAIAVALILVAAIIALFTGVWILPTGGIGLLAGIFMVVAGALILIIVGTMLWLLIRRDDGISARGPRS
jgi:hypothetical protein